MLNTLRMPKCHNTFKSWVTSNYKFNEIYKSIGSPMPIDVTFREGIVSLAKEEQKMFSVADYNTLFKTITHTHRPKEFRIRNYLLDDIDDLHNNVNIYHNNEAYLKKYLKLNSPMYIAVHCPNDVEEYVKRGIYDITIPIIFNENVEISWPYQDIINKHSSLTNNKHNVHLAIFIYDSTNINEIIKYYNDIKCNNSNKCNNSIKSITLHNTGTNERLFYKSLMELSSLKHNLTLCSNFKLDSLDNSHKLETLILMHKCLDIGINNFEVSFFKTCGSKNLLDHSNTSVSKSVITYDFYYKAIFTYILQKCYNISYDNLLSQDGLVDI